MTISISKINGHPITVEANKKTFTFHNEFIYADKLVRLMLKFFYDDEGF